MSNPTKIRAKQPQFPIISLLRPFTTRNQLRRVCPSGRGDGRRQLVMLIDAPSSRRSRTVQTRDTTTIAIRDRSSKFRMQFTCWDQRVFTEDPRSAILDSLRAVRLAVIALV